MTISSELKDLIQYRVSQAQEMIETGRSLVMSGISPRSIINRAYYAMFYSVLAILATINKGSARHSGVIALFNIHFIRSGIFSAEFGKMLQHAFDYRQEADYGTDTFNIDLDFAQKILNDAEKFVAAIEQYLNNLLNT